VKRSILPFSPEKQPPTLRRLVQVATAPAVSV
jgi:hypothetical protein